MTGPELRKIRKRLGLTQSLFGELVGVTKNTVARWERGEVGIRDPMARLIRLLVDQRDQRKGGEKA